MNKYPFGQKLGQLSPNKESPKKSMQSRPTLSPNKLAEAVANKYVRSIIPVSGEPDKPMTPPNAVVQNVANRTASNVMDNENIIQLLPEMELAMQILISSILSPNNMMTCELNYVCDADDLGDLRAGLIEIMKNFFTDTYKINSILPTILEDVLFKKGSYPLATIPETAIDEIINGHKKPSLENIKIEFDSKNNPRSYGILGNSAKGRESLYGFGLESLADALNNYDPETKVGNSTILITDNINLLKFPMVHSRLVEERLQNAYDKREISLEQRKVDKQPRVMTPVNTLLDRDIINQRRHTGYMPVVPVKSLEDLERETVGHPLVLQLPPESVIPVHVPSEPRHHIGYFIALDRHGNPIRANASADYYADLAYNSEAFKEMSTQLLAQTRRNSEGRKDNHQMLLDETIAMYAEVVERDVRMRLSNGIYGDNIEIARPTEIYRTMLARACANMQTQLLFIPINLMTYIAFDYNYYGCGKSLLEATKVLSSIRAMMLFANTYAAVKNSTNHVNVTIDLDPKDPDPTKAVELMTHTFARARQSAYPIGASNPLDIINYLQAAGIHFNIQGHPMYPQTKMSVEDRQTNRAIIDTELDESLKKRHLAALGLAPESVDLSMNVDFAQSIVNSNVLLAKRALNYQKMLTKDVSDFIMKFTANSEYLMDALRKFVDGNRNLVNNTKAGKMETETLVRYFLSKFRATLPEPDMTKLENQKAAFELYTETLELVLPAFVSSEMFDSSIFGELNGNIETLITLIKSYYQRRWLQNNDVLPELFEITESDKDGQPVMDMLKLHEGHMDSVSKSLLEFMKKALPRLAKNDKAITALRDATGAEEPSGDSSSSDDSGNDESGDESGGEGDDFGLDEDMGGEGEEPAAEEGEEDTTEEETPEEEPEKEEPAKEEEPKDEGVEE